MRRGERQAVPENFEAIRSEKEELSKWLSDADLSAQAIGFLNHEFELTAWAGERGPGAPLGSRERDQNPSKISSLSNIFTSLRVALLPLLIISEMRDRIELSFVLLIAIGLSDVFDGLSARWNEGQSPFGAVFDLAAGFTVIFTLFVFYYYYIEGTFPLFLLI